VRISWDWRATPPARGAVVSIGVFDGVHLGHQAILAANLERARRDGAEATVVTFAGHPKQVLLGRSPRTLTCLEHRLELFAAAGIEHTVVLEFDELLREMSAERFARDVLVEALGARAFVLGFDSKFGRDRRGTPELLRELGFEVTVVDQVIVGQHAVSSTAIREAVELGDLDGARRMLGRPVSVLGKVVRGAALGRELGFPTANIDPHHELEPPGGVYYGWVRIVRDAKGERPEIPPERSPLHPAVANIGSRPTVSPGLPERQRLEAHLLDFSGDLYGATLEMQFLGRLREEQRFPSVAALREQIAADVARARGLLQVAADPTN
jgi:riboflavin kinase/FMN adenylyltransferase